MKKLSFLLLLLSATACRAQTDCFGQQIFDPSHYMTQGYDTILKHADTYTQSFAGCSMPMWTAKDRQGRVIAPIDYQGRILFLNFWWPGCKPCIHEFNSLNKLAKEYEGQVLFLSFVSGRHAQMDSVLRLHPLDYRIIPDADSLTTEVFKMSVFPTNIIIGRDGRVSSIMHGSQTDDGLSNYEKLKPMVENALRRK